ncbi:hypothetical protein CsatA_024951 [Cannabis sativa]
MATKKASFMEILMGIPSNQLKQTTTEEKSYSQRDLIIWEKQENFKEQNLSEWSSPLKLLSQDKEALLKVPVLFASFDQTSRLASGYGACSVIAILIAHWLHCNPKLIPTRVQFESLIIQGSSEWRALSNESSYYQNKFYNNHFDIETVINAGIRPVSICTDRSVTGMFGVEKFNLLKDMFSLDNMWETITKDLTTEPKIFVVGWNDHFFVLKLELHVCYIIDSYGSRLFRGCNQAYMLKFDDSSVIYGTHQQILCTGKDCCKEYMRKFLSSTIVMNLEKEYKRGYIQLPHLYEKLQVDMSYMCLNAPSPVPSSSSSSYDAPSPVPSSSSSSYDAPSPVPSSSSSSYDAPSSLQL